MQINYLVVMNELEFISDSFAALFELSKRDTIFLDDVQKEFRPDLQNYIIWKTLSIQNGKLVIGHNLYKQWLNKIKTKGFDDEIDFKPAIIIYQHLSHVGESEVESTSIALDSNPPRQVK